MPARIVTFARGYCYHVYNRGSEKRTIFQSHRDYTKFLARTKDNAKKYAIDVLAFCLMPNHFHFLLKQTSDAPLVLFMNALQLGHAKYFNTKYTRVGPLFQGRFKARLVESDEYLLQLSAYIHRNPVAGLIDSGNRGDSRNLIRRRLRNSPYSSYPEYIGLETNNISKPDTILAYFSKSNPKLTYASFVEQFEPDMEALTPILATTE
ncbi:MAG: transposase [Patescibacteria group bacterium]